MHIKTSDQKPLRMGFGNYSCNWGMHLAGLYENEAERDEIIFGYLKQGCEDGDQLLYCPSERTEKQFYSEFAGHSPDHTGCLHDSNTFRIVSPKDLYYPKGHFSPTEMIHNLEMFYQENGQSNRYNVRATAEMDWIKETIKDKTQLMTYEAYLNYFIPDKAWVSICLYNVNELSGDMLMDVLRTHPYTISGGIITSNPYYLPPDEWLKKYAPKTSMI